MFTIYLIYHSHIDVGFTERQEKIASYQADFIRRAVDFSLSEKQKTRGEREKFKFTAEGFWAVEKYLEKYGEEGKLRLLEAIRSGYFEITAGYLHFAELLDAPLIERSVSYAGDFLKNNGFPQASAAMSSDVNGMSGYFADAFSRSGAKYLISNLNPHHGGPPFGKPLAPFYWKGRSGGRILCWDGLPYHTGNVLGLIPGPMPAVPISIPGKMKTFGGLLDIKSYKDLGRRRVPSVVRFLKRAGYPYDFLSVMASGTYTDNSPVGDGHCELISGFNKKFRGKIEVRTSTLPEFFARLEKERDIPTFEGEWNDWWTDGVISTPAETNAFRRALRILRDAEKAGIEIGEEERARLEKLLILFSEHTWGHSAAFSSPSKLIVKELDARKSAYAADALDIAEKIAARLPKEENIRPGGKISYDEKSGIVDGGAFKIFIDREGVADILYGGKSILSKGESRLGRPIYQIFPNGKRSRAAGYGYSGRRIPKSEIYYGELINYGVRITGAECEITLDYRIKGANFWQTEIKLIGGEKKIFIKTRLLKSVELSPEGMYVSFPLYLEDGKWRLDKPGGLTRPDEKLPGTCADYFSCIRGAVLENKYLAAEIDIFGSPMLTFEKIKLWNYSTEIDASAGPLYSWLANNKWETNFRAASGQYLENEYILKIEDL
jgi:Glycosyl hydrolases family 38 N-terminal domain.